MPAPWQLLVDEYEVAYGQKIYNVGYKNRRQANKV